MKSNYYDNIISQLKNICGGEAVEDISATWLKVDEQVEEEYRKYMAAEEQLKNIEEEIKSLGEVRGGKESLSQGAAKTAEQIEL